MSDSSSSSKLNVEQEVRFPEYSKIDEMPPFFLMSTLHKDETINERPFLCEGICWVPKVGYTGFCERGGRSGICPNGGECDKRNSILACSKVLKGSHRWLNREERFAVEKSSDDGRFIYSLDVHELIILDLLHNTKMVLTGPNSFNPKDFVVLNDNTILVLHAPHGKNYSYVELLRFNIAEGRFELQTICNLNEAHTFVFTDIVFNESVKKKAILVKGYASSIPLVLVGRLNIHEKKFELQSTIRHPNPNFHLSDDGVFLSVDHFKDFRKIYIYNLNTNLWSEEKLSKLEPVDALNQFRYYWSHKYLYVYESSTSFLNRLNLQTKECIRLPIQEQCVNMKNIFPIVNADGEDEGILFINRTHVNLYDRQVEIRSISRLMFKPESLAKLSWIRLQKHFNENKDSRRLDILLTKKPFTKIFPPINDFMKPIPHVWL